MLTCCSGSSTASVVTKRAQQLIVLAARTEDQNHLAYFLCNTSPKESGAFSGLLGRLHTCCTHIYTQACIHTHKETKTKAKTKKNKQARLAMRSGNPQPSKDGGRIVRSTGNPWPHRRRPCYKTNKTKQPVRFCLCPCLEMFPSFLLQFQSFRPYFKAFHSFELIFVQGE